MEEVKIIQIPNQRNVVLQYDENIWQAPIEVILFTTPEDESLKTKWFDKPIQHNLLSQKALAITGKLNFKFTNNIEISVGKRSIVVST